MKDKVALVTGGTGGIGTAICQQLASRGVRVVASYFRNGDHEPAKAWQQLQKKQGFDIEINYCDVADFESAAALIAQIEERMGSLDILVNNAGITRDCPLRKMQVNQWQEVLRTNLDSIFNVTQNAINGMITRGYGRIINISSINGQKGQFGQTNYAAAKAGMHGFTKSLAAEVANKGITVNSISPGYIATEMVMQVPEEIRNKIITEIPVKRLGTPDEIARTVVFLAAAESGFITGSNIMVNGGQYFL